MTTKGSVPHNRIFFLSSRIGQKDRPEMTLIKLNRLAGGEAAGFAPPQPASRIPGEARSILADVPSFALGASTFVKTTADKTEGGQAGTRRCRTACPYVPATVSHLKSVRRDAERGGRDDRGRGQTVSLPEYSVLMLVYGNVQLTGSKNAASARRRRRALAGGKNRITRRWPSAAAMRCNMLKEWPS
jgi:hypothetical protein